MRAGDPFRQPQQPVAEVGQTLCVRFEIRGRPNNLIKQGADPLITVAQMSVSDSITFCHSLVGIDVKGVTMSIRRIVSVLCLILIAASGASAASYQIIVHCGYNVDIKKIAAAY